MIKYPFLKDQPTSRKVIDIFKGYNHNLRIGDGEFYEMENMTSDDYPVLSTRRKRGKVADSAEYSSLGMYYVPDVGVFAAISKKEDKGEYCALYILTTKGEFTYICDLSTDKKQFALMGKALIIAPDMVWVDTETLSHGKMGYSLSVSNGTINIELCNAHGNAYTDVVVSEEPPTAVGHRALWLYADVLKQYDAPTGEWISIPFTYLKISGLGDHSFNAGDGVTISGLVRAAYDGSYVIETVSIDYIVIAGSTSEKIAQDCGAYPLLIAREIPKLDFIVESGNRLWGCAKDTNEIYACKLGDYKNWNCFQGLSTDSWVGTVGTPGEFTGAVVQNGYPIFYKENYKHKVWPSASGAHQITVTECNGVEKGSESSLAVLNGTVFYKSPFGICADDGGGAVEIGGQLGDVGYTNAAGAIYDQKYYLNMSDSSGKYHLFVYDISRNLWYRENSPSPGHLASGGSRLYAVSGGDIWDLTGGTGDPETDVFWMVQTGDLGLTLPEQKRISRLTLRLSLEPGATLEIYAQYDQEPVWQKLGQVYGTDLRSFSLPVRPRRCDHLRLKLQGTGMCKIYSIAKTLEKGSELV